MKVKDLLVRLDSIISLVDEVHRKNEISELKTELKTANIEDLADNVNLTDDKKRTLLHYLSMIGETTLLTKILNTIGVYVDSTDKNGITPLCALTRLSYGLPKMEIVELLLRNNADVNKFDKNEDSPLLLSIQNGHIKIAKLLLANNADVNKANKDYTLLLWAARSGNIEITKLLLKYKVDPNFKDKNGRTALDEALDNNNIEIAKLLQRL